MRRALKILLGVAMLGGILLLFVFPARTYLQQQHTISTASQQLTLLRNENAKLGAQASSLQDPATIERIAHQQYGLVKSGQQAYEIVPPSATTTPSTGSKTSNSNGQTGSSSTSGPTSSGSSTSTNGTKSQGAPWYRCLELWRHL